MNADDVPVAPAARVLGPLALLAPAGLVGGRLGAVVDGRDPDGSLVVPVTAVAVAVLVGAARRARAGGDVVAAALTVLAMLLVTLAGVLLRLDGAAHGPVADLVDRGGVATVEADVAAEPRHGARGWRTTLRVRTVDGSPAGVRAAVVLDEALPLGTPLTVRASARPLPDGGYGRWLAQAHAVAVLDVTDVVTVGRAGPLVAWSEQVRARIRRAATRHLDGGRGALLVGFVTGDTRLLPDADAEAMRATGLSHLTAVSGSNTAILLGGVAGLLALLRLPARGRQVLLAVTVVAFVVLTRLEPSVLRAGTMALLVLAAAASGVARDARHLLAGAVMLLVLVDPLLTWSLGLLLSAGATLGVLVVAPALTARLERHLPRPLAGLLGITLGAQLAVSPVLLLGFGTIPWVSVPANLLAVPAAAFGATVAFVGSAVALVHVGAASSVFVLAGPAAGAVLTVARAGAALPGGPTLPDAPGPRALAVVAVGATLLLIRSLRPLGRDRRPSEGDRPPSSDVPNRFGARSGGASRSARSDEPRRERSTT